MKNVLFLVLVTFFALTARSQSVNKDSLLKELKIAREDTNKVNLLREIGIAIIYQNPPASIPYFRQAYQLAHRLNFYPGLERNYAATSTAYAFNAKYDSAKLFIDTAITYALKVGDASRLALVYLNRADAYDNLNDYSLALKDCDTAMNYAEHSGNKDRLARIYQIMSGIYDKQKQLAPALEYNAKAIALFNELGNRQMVGKGTFNSAMLLRTMNKGPEALLAINKAIAIADSLNDVNNFSAYYQVLAGILTDAKKYKEARAAAQTALRYAKETGHRRQQANVLGEIANISLAENDYTAAVGYGLQAYDVFKELKDLGREQSAAAFLAEAYGKKGESDLAYRYLKISSTLNDSLLQKKFDEENARLQTAFDVKQKESEILMLNKDRQLQEQRLWRQQILLLGSLALVVLAIAGIFLLVSRYRLRQRVKEMELRNSIAADLHDEVGSSLSSIYMLSEMAGASGTSAASQKDMLHKVTSYSKETMDKMGDIVWMIKQHSEDGKDLQERMQRFLYEMCSSKNISHHYEGELLQTLKLNTEQKKTLYLVFKEAVNNALKYAMPNHINVSISKQQNGVALRISDDGRGFDHLSAKKGNGLANMQNRAKELGGKTEILSSEKGTTVLCTLPV